MSKKISVGTALVLILLAAVLTFQITFIAVNSKYSETLNEFSENMKMYDKLSEVDNYYRSYYVGEIDDEVLCDSVLDGYIYGTGDKYAYYLDKEEFADAMQDNSGEMVGIGIQVIYSESLMEVIMVMPDSPALEAGIEPGDIIYSVAGESVAELGYYAAVEKMLGEAGTNAEFTVIRDGEAIDYSITRRKVEAVSVMSRRLESDPTVGIVKILQFDLGTPAQFKDTCEDMLATGVTRFIFDVRYNPGGDLTAICKVLDYLLPEGPIVRIAYSDGSKQEYSSDKAHIDAPMCVLINESTASAGELFACALQDFGVAKLVGTPTFGKGTMQSVIELSDGSGFGISTAMYYPPYSDCYEGVGVTPDYPCEMSEATANMNIYKIPDADDTQLQAALSVLNGESGE